MNPAEESEQTYKMRIKERMIRNNKIMHLRYSMCHKSLSVPQVSYYQRNEIKMMQFERIQHSISITVHPFVLWSQKTQFVHWVQMKHQWLLSDSISEGVLKILTSFLIRRTVMSREGLRGAVMHPVAPHDRRSVDEGISVSHSWTTGRPLVFSSGLLVHSPQFDQLQRDAPGQRRL